MKMIGAELKASAGDEKYIFLEFNARDALRLVISKFKASSPSDRSRDCKARKYNRFH